MGGKERRRKTTGCYSLSTFFQGGGVHVSQLYCLQNSVKICLVQQTHRGTFPWNNIFLFIDTVLFSTVICRNTAEIILSTLRQMNVYSFASHWSHFDHDISTAIATSLHQLMRSIVYAS